MDISIDTTSTSSNIVTEQYIKDEHIATTSNVVKTVEAYNKQVDKLYYSKNQIVVDENALQKSLNYLARQLQADYDNTKVFRPSAYVYSRSTTSAFDALTGAIITNIEADNNTFQSAGILQKINILSHIISGTSDNTKLEGWNSESIGNIIGSTDGIVTNDNRPIIGLAKAVTDAYGYKVEDSIVKGLTEIDGTDVSSRTVLSESQIASMLSVAIDYVNNKYDDKLESIIGYLLYTANGLSDSFKWVLKNGSKDGITEAPLYVKSYDPDKKAYILVKADLDASTISYEPIDSIYSEESSRYGLKISNDYKTISVYYRDNIEDDWNDEPTYTINVPTYEVEFDIGKNASLHLDNVKVGDKNIYCNNYYFGNVETAKVSLPLGTQFTAKLGNRDVKCFYIMDVDKSSTNVPTSPFVYETNIGISNYSLKDYLTSESDKEYNENSYLKSSLLFTCKQSKISIYKDDSINETLNVSYIDEYNSYSYKFDTLPSREGYSINGIKSSSGDFKIDNNTISLDNVGTSSDIDIWFDWTINKKDVSLDYCYTENNTEKIEVRSVDYGEIINLPIPNRDGYTFDGWYTESTYENKIISIDIDSNNTVYAKWTAIQYTVTLILNGGTYNGDETVTVDYNSNYTVPTEDSVYRLGYTFKGWFTSPNFKDGTEKTETLNIENNLVLYAKWEIITYSIEYNLNDNDINSATDEITNFDFENFINFNIEQLPFALGNPENTGYTFAGWKTVDNKSITNIESSNLSSLLSSETNTISLTASWEPKDIGYVIEIYDSQSLSSGDRFNDLFYTYQNFTSAAYKNDDGIFEIGTAKVGTSIDIDVINYLIDNKDIDITVGLEVESMEPIVLSGNKDNVAKIICSVKTYSVYYHNTCYFNDTSSWSAQEDTENFNSNLGTLVKTVKYSIYATPLPYNSDLIKGKDGFTFNGWVDSNGTIVNSIPSNNCNDVHYYATWSQSEPETNAISYTINKYINDSNTLTSSLSPNENNFKDASQSISYRYSTIDWTDLNNTVEFSSYEIYGTTYDDWSDLDKQAYMILIKYNSISLDSPEAKQLTIEETNVVQAQSLVFANKGIFAHYMDTDTYTDISGSSNLASATNSVLIIYPVDNTDTTNVDDTPSGNIAEVQIDTKLPNYSYIKWSTDDNDIMDYTNGIQVDTNGSIQFYIGTSDRYKESEKYNVSINNKLTQVPPFTAQADGMEIIEATTVGTCIKELINDYNTNKTGRYYYNNGTITGIPANGSVTGGYFVCRVGESGSWTKVENTNIKTTKEPLTVSFKYWLSDYYYPSSEVSKTIDVKKLNITIDPFGGTIIKNKNLISADYYTDDSLSLLADSSKPYTINIVGAQNIELLPTAITRAGYTISYDEPKIYVDSDSYFKPNWSPKYSEKDSSISMPILYNKTDTVSSEIYYSYKDNATTYASDVELDISKTLVSYSDIKQDENFKNWIDAISDGYYITQDSSLYYKSNSDAEAKYEASSISIESSEEKTVVSFNTSTNPSTATIDNNDNVFNFDFALNIGLQQVTSTSISMDSIKLEMVNDGNNNANLNIILPNSIKDIYNGYSVDVDEHKITLYPMGMEGGNTIDWNESDDATLTTSIGYADTTLHFLPLIGNPSYPATTFIYRISENEISKADLDETKVDIQISTEEETNDYGIVQVPNGYSVKSEDI